MNECPECGAHCEWKTRKKATQPFLSHPKGGCHEYISGKLMNRCSLFDQDFGTPRTCEEDCENANYCFETKIGSTTTKIYFDTPGPPWIKHDCWIRQNPNEQPTGFQPCTIDQYVSFNESSFFGKKRLLGFLIQIEKDGLLQKLLIAIQSRNDNKQFVSQLHQPFFYKEIAPHVGILNTYQNTTNASGKLLYAPKEYVCRTFDPKSGKGWRKILGDKNQPTLNFD
jgi:hypothetical protein